MKNKNELTQTAKLFEILDHLSSIPRIGPVLWEGVPVEETETVADHKCKVAYIAMILGDLVSKEGKKIDMEYLLRRAIIHDWDKAVLGDVPSDSPSYQSYFEKNIGKEFNHARNKTIKEIAGFVKDEIGKDYSAINVDQNHPLEAKIEEMAILIAILLELLVLRKRGYKDRYIELFWVKTLQQSEKTGKEFSFTKNLIKALDGRFDKFTELNPFLAKGKYSDRKAYRKRR